MNSRILLPFLLSGVLCAQVKTPPPEEPAPDTVLATVDGKKLTYGELRTYLDGLSPEQKTQALSDRKQLVQQYALMAKLLDFAEKDKLAQESPYKEALEASRKQILTNAEINYHYIHTLVTADEQKKFYDSNKDRYTQVKLQVLYLGFVSDTAAKESNGKYRTEAAAKKLMDDLRAQIHSGDDFVRMVKKYSEDEESKSRNGEYGTLKKSDNLPAEIKGVVFALKEGEMSQPLLQRNGFYLFRAETVGLRPYDEVRDDIYNELKETRVRQWIGETQNSIQVKFENDPFFTATQPQPH